MKGDPGRPTQAPQSTPRILEDSPGANEGPGVRPEAATSILSGKTACLAQGKAECLCLEAGWLLTYGEEQGRGFYWQLWGGVAGCSRKAREEADPPKWFPARLSCGWHFIGEC